MCPVSIDLMYYLNLPLIKNRVGGWGVRKLWLEVGWLFWEVGVVSL